MADLTDLGTVKSWMGQLAPANTTADTLLSDLITATSADFLRAIKRPDLMQSSYTEARVGDGSPRLVVRHWPLTEVTSLTVSGTSVAQQSAPGSTGWYIDTNADPERNFTVFLANEVFTDAAPIAVSYLAGYPSVPNDIQQAVTEWVVYRYAKKTSTALKENRGIDGERNQFEESTLPPNTQRVIDNYMRTWPKLEGGPAKAAPAQQQQRRPMAAKA